MIPGEAGGRLAYNLAPGERCPSGLRCRSRKAVWSKATAGSNPALSATQPSAAGGADGTLRYGTSLWPLARRRLDRPNDPLAQMLGRGSDHFLKWPLTRLAFRDSTGALGDGNLILSGAKANGRIQHSGVKERAGF